MNNTPILILQMQRMGDLILSFPLMGWLKQLFPQHPLWVVGEPDFFHPLMPLSPAVTYFPYSAASALKTASFHAVINLSHREEAATLAGAVKADMILGPFRTDSGKLYIQGDWQLYRASLTHNSRYNRYHWSDLHALDIVPASLRCNTMWPAPLVAAPSIPAKQKAQRVGLFLGASEPEKHPDVLFWAGVALQLLKQGYKPVLLGGTAEKRLGNEVAEQIQAHALNLCGHFSLEELAYFIKNLDLLVVPDTGPMHLAVWTGTPVLNLSLGPVNPWETGPTAPGHHILRPELLCSDCWQCTETAFFCKKAIQPDAVVHAIDALMSGAAPEKFRLPVPLSLLKTCRDQYGLFDMQPVHSFKPDTVQQPEHAVFSTSKPFWLDKSLLGKYALAHFWKQWFAEQLTLERRSLAKDAWNTIVAQYPDTAASFHTGLSRWVAFFSKSCRNISNTLADSQFWEQAPEQLRPVSGFMHLLLQNEHGSHAAKLRCTAMLEHLHAITVAQ